MVKKKYRTTALIVQAGLMAPFASSAPPDENFRRFVVIARNSPKMKLVEQLARRRAAQCQDELNQELAQNPELEKTGRPFAERLKRMSETGVQGIGASPYYIVIAELKRFPAEEQQLLSHCLQNMWLKATALNPGFHLGSLYGTDGYGQELL